MLSNIEKMRDELKNVNKDGEKIANFRKILVGMKLAVYRGTNSNREGIKTGAMKNLLQEVVL